VLDIREGDILVVGTKEYPIKACSEWSGSRMGMATFKRQATISASTKRAISNGDKRSPASSYLTGLTVTPLDPVNAQLATTFGLDTPHELLQTFTGDATGYLQLILEDLKR
jgi:hypothetical protein